MIENNTLDLKQQEQPRKRRGLLSAPVFADEDKNRNSFLLNFITIANFIAVSIVILLALLAGRDNLQQSLISSLQQGLPTLFILIITQVLLRTGRVRAASITYGVLVLLYDTYSLYNDGGTASYGLFNYILVVMIFGLLLDNRFAIISAIAAVVFSFVILNLDGQGALPSVTPAENPGLVGLLTFIYTISLTTSNNA